MAGRTPINSARMIKVRTQIVLRAYEADVENRTQSLRLMELVERKKGEGNLPQYIAKALMNQMLSDEIAPDKGGATDHAGFSAPQAREGGTGLGINESLLESMARGMLAKLMSEMGVTGALANTGHSSAPLPPIQASHHVAKIEFGHERDLSSQNEEKLGTQVTLDERASSSLNVATPSSSSAEVAIEQTMQAITNMGAERVPDAAAPRKRMGGSALKAMG